MEKTRDIDEIYRATLKANLILSDYALATDPEEKKIYLDLLDRYVMILEDPAVTLYYTKIAGATNTDEKEIYIEILVDLLEDRKSKIPGAQV